MSRHAVKHELLGVVENQVRDNDPPETRQTLDRLQREGVSRARAVEMIAAVLLDEMNAMLRDRRTYDATRYRRLLNGLKAK